ncbi:MAG: radical SAM protein [Candidatus Riflebacteria bacterium]|nr:radical SAM protein [Candidatus Riflebacteria bacterium]
MSHQKRKLLLTSVFKPFGVDDEFGKKENVLEPMHNQVTRAQEIFSIRSHNPTFALRLLAENIKTPVTVMDFPTQDEFIAELKSGNYSDVGISFIVPNFDKARQMASLTRTYSPQSKIILGGHGVTVPDIEKLVSFDEICFGEGVSWLRSYFQESEGLPIVHPIMKMDFARKLCGIPSPNVKSVLIPGVGCPYRCDFCCTSHFFKGYTSFFRSNEALFQAMIDISNKLGTNEFFVLDENILKDKDKIYELAALMRKHERRFRLDVFASLDALAAMPVEKLVEAGIEFVWVGIESRENIYSKTRGIDARDVFIKLRKHGISVLTSSILFLDHHTQANIWDDIDYTISLGADFIQFMQLGPLPRTALYDRLEKSDRIMHDVPYMEWHGQDKIWFKHPIFSREQSKNILDVAFKKEYNALGPTLMRIAETKMMAVENGVVVKGDTFMEARYQDQVKYVLQFRPLLPLFEKFAPNEKIQRQAKKITEWFNRRFGKQSFSDAAQSLAALFLARVEQKKLRLHLPVSQPPTFIERYRMS